MNVVHLKEFAFDYISLEDKLSKSDKIMLGQYVYEADQYQVMHLLTFGTIVPPMTEQMNKDVETVFSCMLELYLLNERPIGADPNVKYTVLSTADKEALVKMGKAGAEKVAKVIDKKGITALKRLAASWANTKFPAFKSWKIGNIQIDIGKYLDPQWATQYHKANIALHAGAAVAATAAAGLIFLVAKKAYKKYLSKAVRSCRKYKGIDRNECVRKFYLDAIKKDIEVMEKNKQACNTTRRPGKCIEKVDKRIRKQKTKLQKVLTMKKAKKI